MGAPLDELVELLDLEKIEEKRWQTDRDRIRRETAERVRRAPITGRHEAA